MLDKKKIAMEQGMISRTLIDKKPLLTKNDSQNENNS
jgi:hypothetical protein